MTSLIIIFIARQHPVHADCDIVMVFLSISLFRAGLNEWTYYCQTSLTGALFWFLEPSHHYKIPGGIPSAGALNTPGWKNLANIAVPVHSYYGTLI